MAAARDARPLPDRSSLTPEPLHATGRLRVCILLGTAYFAPFDGRLRAIPPLSVVER